jgi:hypothetical protein
VTHNAWSQFDKVREDMRVAHFLGRPALAPGKPLGIRFRRLVLIAMCALSLCSTGCTLFRGVNAQVAYNDRVNDFVLGWRNSVWARQAWYERADHFVGEPHLAVFGAGFRSGYADVAAGGSGCPPPLPPRKYWSWQYQTPEGQAKVAAWFSGYPHGARAAEEEQAGEYQNIQVSYVIEQQYSPEFQSGEMLDLDGASQGGHPRGIPLEPYPDPSHPNGPVEIYQDTRMMVPPSPRNPQLSLPRQSAANRQVPFLAPIGPQNIGERPPVEERPGAWPAQ